MSVSKVQLEAWKTAALQFGCKQAGRSLLTIDDEDAQFFGAVACWINKQDDEACLILRKLSSTKAMNLLELISKEKINVLLQGPWLRNVPQTLLDGMLSDTKFNVTNYTIDKKDKNLLPTSSIHEWYDTKGQPDFYLCNMVEWHYLPSDLSHAPFPVLGQIADIDYHIQALWPRLNSFDAILVTDQTEYQRMFNLLRQDQLFIVPHSFGWRQTPREPSVGIKRELDLFISGTMLRAYHPDKAEVLIKLLGQSELNLLLVEGHLNWHHYLALQNTSKLAFGYYRHYGGFLTRAMDALTIGSLPLVPEGHVSVAELPNDFFAEYKSDFSDIVDVAIAAKKKYDDLSPHEISRVSRSVFNQDRTASRYLRASTAVAAIAGGEKKKKGKIDNRRMVAHRGWDIKQYDIALPFFRQKFKQFSQHYEEGKDASNLNLLGREYILAYYTSVLDKKPARELFEHGRSVFRNACHLNPNNLIFFFNYIRMLIIDQDKNHQEIRNLLLDFLKKNKNEWGVDISDDIMPYDFLETSLDYRGYFDHLTSIVNNDKAKNSDIKFFKNLIFASLHWLSGHYLSKPSEFENAYNYHSNFAIYQYDFSLWTLQSKSNSKAVEKAALCLEALLNGSYLYYQAALIILQYRDLLSLVLKEQQFDNAKKLIDATMGQACLYEPEELFKIVPPYNKLPISNHQLNSIWVVESLIENLGSKVAYSELIDQTNAAINLFSFLPWRRNDFSNIENVQVFSADSVHDSLLPELTNEITKYRMRNLTIVLDINACFYVLDNLLEIQNDNLNEKIHCFVGKGNTNKFTVTAFSGPPELCLALLECLIQDSPKTHMNWEGLKEFYKSNFHICEVWFNSEHKLNNHEVSELDFSACLSKNISHYRNIQNQNTFQ